MADPPPAPAPQRPAAPVRSSSDSLPVDIYAQFGPRSREDEERELGKVPEEGRVSMYVRIVDEMIDTVLSQETYLLSHHELLVIQRFRALKYEPKYLLVRLLLRKTNKVFSLNELRIKYSTELGHHLPSAMKELINPLGLVGEDQMKVETERKKQGTTPAEKMNGFFSAEELRNISNPSPMTVGNAEAGPSDYASRKMSHEAIEIEKSRTWKDVSSGMTEEEEKREPELARALKLSAWEALQASMSSSTKDVTPPSATPNKSDSTPPRKGKEKETSDDFYKMKEGSTDDITAFARGERDMQVEEMIKYLGMLELSAIAKEFKCWKAKYTRGEVIQTLLHSASKQSRLGFSPIQTPSKSSPPTQQTTLQFARKSSTPVKPVQTGRSILQKKVIDALGGKAIQISLPFRLLISRINLIYYRSTITPQAGVAKSLMLPDILTTSHKRAYPSEIKPRRSVIWQTRDALLEYERALEMEAIVDESLGEQNHSGGAWVGPSGFGFGTTGGRLEGAKRVRKVWDGVYEKWKLAAQQAGDVKMTGSRHILDRFTLGHILTRVVSKGATALGILHEYDLECEVLRSLLAQRVWRRGKRGAWYDRLALVLMTHYKGDQDKKREAVQVCIDGLTDDDTHLIYRPRLSRRLTRLEKQLDLPSDERHICEAELRKSEQRTLKAVRVKAPPSSKTGQKRKVDGENEDEEGGSERMSSGKTWWMGREGESGVEQWVLEWWEEKGYKAFHSESSILTTLFGLLFWPILYKDISGAFETPYQLAPLDLGDDSFYQSRREDIEERLDRMTKKGETLKMLREVDERERERGTLAIGVKWAYERVDLEEIVQCLGGKALSVICRMFCEEYGHRASGVPDLIVWHPEHKTCRFVEVKSPNDTLSETQKVWISVLLSAGIDVEVCHVAEATIQPPHDKGNKRRKDGAGGWGGKRDFDDDQEGDHEEENEEEEDEEDEEFKYESGDEGKGQGRLLSHAESEGERQARARAMERRRREDGENIDPVKERKREKSTPARKAGSVLGCSAAQPIEIS